MGFGIPNHATIISNVDREKGKIQYSAHTDPRIDHDVYKNYLAKNDNHSATILRINEGKMIYD